MLATFLICLSLAQSPAGNNNPPHKPDGSSLIEPAVKDLVNGLERVGKDYQREARAVALETVAALGAEARATVSVNSWACIGSFVLGGLLSCIATIGLLGAVAFGAYQARKPVG